MWHGINVSRSIAIFVVGAVAVGCVVTHQTSAIGGVLAAVVGGLAVMFRGEKGGDDAAQ